MGFRTDLPNLVFRNPADSVTATLDGVVFTGRPIACFALNPGSLGQEGGSTRTSQSAASATVPVAATVALVLVLVAAGVGVLWMRRRAAAAAAAAAAIPDFVQTVVM